MESEADIPLMRPEDTSGEGKWLTYDEISQLRGIGRDSAIKLVQRSKWRRTKGNDGTARIFVPPDFLTPTTRKHSLDNHPGHSPELSRAIKALEAGLAFAKERIEQAEGRAGTLQVELAAEKEARVKAEEQMRQGEEMRRRIEEDQRAFWGQGRFARTIAAWRGRR